MKFRWFLLVLGVLSLGAACGEEDSPAPVPAASTAPCKEAPFVGSPLGLRCGHVIDAQGRVVNLWGVNARVDGIFDVSFDDGRIALETIPPFTAEDAAQMRAWGFDALRLPINWSGVEPTRDGGFKEEYLDRVQQVLDLAKAQGILVLIDFHQDAYGKDIGEDGAPLWAIEPPPTELLQGPLEDLEKRRLSPQVKAAFETFFGDSPKGAELRERFCKMAAHVAARFKDHPAVLGFELFNEPVFVTNAQLLRFHQQAFAAVRAAAPSKLVLFEPPAERNFLDSFALGDGPIGEGTVYAPHIYKFAFTTFPASATKERIAKQNLTARDEAASWKAGMMITEWGYDPNGNRAEEYLTWQRELQDEIQASSFLWLWKEESQGRWGCFDHNASGWTERSRLKEILARVRPAAIAGWPKQYNYDRATGVFLLTFTADPTLQAPTRIAISPVLGPPIEVRCDGTMVSVPLQDGALDLDCGRGTSSKHTITVKVKPLP
ncbi:MAG: cellulase family glycosylhydrolase [Myxococcales bacterium]|nr:cellulase family glycosylhydrolase [Polyangiaceae bacterium]MDW8251126.1 cellulase family glycosylhydrolase [Myxococcales bacterium]